MNLDEFYMAINIHRMRVEKLYAKSVDLHRKINALQEQANQIDEEAVVNRRILEALDVILDYFDKVGVDANE